MEPVITVLSRSFSGTALLRIYRGITLVIPYVLPFYLLLAVMEDSGYLTRIAVMLDRGMHKSGCTAKP